MLSTEQWVPEHVIVEQLHHVVEDAIDSIAKATALSSREVMQILEEVDMTKFRRATEDAFKKISIATDLNSEEIADILTERKLASLDDVVYRLHEKSKADRKNLAS
ncbi:MAG: hypothetical protein K2P57_05120 [Burkholderiales bacterium]|nr:hypothetical protein [Burkholderiales bacterium]